MFEYIIKIDGEPMYAMKSIEHVNALFSYWKEEAEINAFEVEFEKLEIIKGEFDIERVADELGSDRLYVMTIDSESVIAVDWDIGYNTDMYQSFNCDGFFGYTV